MGPVVFLCMSRESVGIYDKHVVQGAMHLDHPWLNMLMGPKCLTHTLEWNLRICLLDRMFDEDYRVDPNFLQRYEFWEFI